VDKKSEVIGPGKRDACNCQEAIDICPVQAISRSGQIRMVRGKGRMCENVEMKIPKQLC